MGQLHSSESFISPSFASSSSPSSSASALTGYALEPVPRILKQ
jgi:hypothetical protein